MIYDPLVKICYNQNKEKGDLRISFAARFKSGGFKR